jgi:membrane protease YdiL (CAAX protease family)
MAALSLASVWCLLLLGAALRPWLGAEGALVGAYAAAGGLLLATRRPAPGMAPLAACALALAAGFVALPAWLTGAVLAGVALGLAPPAPAPPAIGVASWLALVVLAPLFEELLYRERVLGALRPRIGAPLALAASSALFAAPHLEAWSVLTTFGVGLALGALQLATGRVALAIAAHAGLNAAALACKLPPGRAALPPAAAALAAAALLVLAVACTRGHAARTRVRG